MRRVGAALTALGLSLGACGSRGSNSDNSLKSADANAPSATATATASASTPPPIFQKDAKYLKAEEARKVWWTECTRRMNEATNGPSGAAASEWCEENEPSMPPYARESEPRFERVTVAEARDWWPYRPLLRAVDLQRGLNEQWYAWGLYSVGRKADPGKENSGISALYYVSPATPRANSDGEILASGGFDVRFTFFPAAQGVPHKEVEPDERAVIVRGHPARVRFILGGKGTTDDIRFIFWYEPQINGGTVDFSIVTNPSVYSDQQVVDFINRLVEVK